MSSKKKSYREYIFYTIILGLFLWPTSRTFFQQQMMKIGFFQPKFSNKAVLNNGTDITETASFTSLDGQVINTVDLKGKVVFINFWATWCGPCIAEMPSIQVLYNRFKDNENVAFLLVEVDGNREGAQKFMNTQKLHLPLFFPNSNIPSTWLGGTIPSTVVLNKSGILVDQKQGMYDYSGLGVQDFIQHLIDAK